MSGASDAASMARARSPEFVRIQNWWISFMIVDEKSSVQDANMAARFGNAHHAIVAYIAAAFTAANSLSTTQYAVPNMATDL